MVGYWIEGSHIVGDIYMTNVKDDTFTCSCCGVQQKMRPGFLFPYCPACGAEMDAGFTREKMKKAWIGRTKKLLSDHYCRLVDVMMELDEMPKKEKRLRKEQAMLEAHIKKLCASLKEWEGGNDGEAQASGENC